MPFPQITLQLTLAKRASRCEDIAMSASLSAVAPLAVLNPPDAVPSEPPVATRVQVLPFDALSWENFERLCHRLTAFDGDIE